MTLIDTLLTTLNRHRARRNNRARVRRMTATFWGRA